ncbi:MAG TPA: hypothetical protein PKE55_11695 [Kiritimatiellia bacterium]|nr:hypothetical protein [Kiritimatiellia bacterium]
MCRSWLFLAALMVWWLGFIPVEAGAETRVGGGIHYWRTLDKVSLKNFDRDGFAYVVSLQHKSSALLKFQGDVEIFPSNYAGTSGTSWAPQGFLLLGGGLYGGLGIGINYLEDGWAERPFYILRAGVDIELLPSIYLDIHANYRFEQFNKIKSVDEDIDTDVVTLGAAVRIVF